MGVINDQSLISGRKINSGDNINGNANNTNNNILNDDMQLASGDISYQFVHKSPININFLDYTTGLDQKLEALKFNIYEIKNIQNN